MAVSQGVRIRWADLPERVRTAVGEIVGAPVVAAVSQPGGFSPGTADRIRTSDGRRAFVKAVSPAQNDKSPSMHRREGAISAQLPAQVPAPRLLGRYDDGEWVALVLEDVDGRHPATPWQPSELRAVLDTLATLARELTPSPVHDVPKAAEVFAHDFRGWDRIRSDPPADLDPWVAGQLDQLCALGERSLEVMSGQTLTHSDVRADNLLIRPDGTVAVVDWPWACLGPRWLDSLLLLINVRVHGGHDTGALLAACAETFDAQRDDLVAVLVGAGGYFTDVARRPAPPGLPTVRAFQRVQSEAVIGWLRELVGTSAG